ncbi:phosphotransferase family protein [Leifsonia sp. RAF41]|uniref:phosphotransferase family protein n=1 Tax=Leifsonia sp. RAF41 TaxID=3233056 RepID=UPI003F96B18A
MGRAPTGNQDAAVGAMLGGDVVSVGPVRRTVLDYDAFFAHRELSRLDGEALVEGERRPWSLIEKRTEGPHLADPYLYDNAVRELDAYRSGMFDDMPVGIRAPRVYGTLLEADGAITLSIEDVRHEGSRPLDAQAIVTAAGDLGRMNGRWFGSASAEPWFFAGWIDRHGQPGAVEAGLATVRRAHPDVVPLWGDHFADIHRLIRAQSRVRAVLESLPHTVCHHDAVGANVFRTSAATVLIDWESVGPGTVGADLASLLLSPRRGDASVHVVASVFDEAVEAYIDGFRDQVPAVAPAQIRQGVDAAIALRWKLAVDVLASLESGEPAIRGSLRDESPETALDELIQLVGVVLAAAGRTLDRPGASIDGKPVALRGCCPTPDVWSSP